MKGYQWITEAYDEMGASMHQEWVVKLKENFENKDNALGELKIWKLIEHLKVAVVQATFGRKIEPRKKWVVPYKKEH